MFCKNCGKELKDDWGNCPYCGSRVLNNVEKIEYRNFGTYLLLTFVTCGIYDIYSCCRYVKDINKVCEGDGKESEDFITVLFLTVITCGIYGWYWWYVQGERLQRVGLKYGVRIRENGNSILFWLIPANFIMMGFGTFIARYIMFDNMNMIAKAYNGDMSEKELRGAKRPHPNLVQNVWTVYGIILAVTVLLVVAVIRTYSFEEMGTEPDEALEDAGNIYDQDADDYENSSEDENVQVDDVENQVETISGFVVDINAKGIVIEQTFQGGKIKVTMDSYNFSYDEYHQCSVRCDMEDLDSVSTGDFVSVVRPLEKGRRTTILCFEILSYSEADFQFNETTEPTGFDWRGFYIDQYSGRAKMGVGFNADCTDLCVQITWPNGYNNSTVWELNTITGGVGILTYTGIKKLVYYGEDGEVDHEEILSTDESGMFIQEINNGNHVYWYDNKDEYNRNCDFLMMG